MIIHLRSHQTRDLPRKGAKAEKSLHFLPSFPQKPKASNKVSFIPPIFCFYEFCGGGGNTSESVDLYVFCMPCMISMLTCMLLCAKMLDLAIKPLKTEIYLMLNDFCIKYVSTYKVFQEKWLSSLVTIFFGLKTQILGLKCEKYKIKGPN